MCAREVSELRCWSSAGPMPYRIASDFSFLQSGVKSLFQTSGAFCDKELHGTGVSNCFLAAGTSAGTSDSTASVEAELRHASPIAAKAFLELLHGQEVDLAQHQDFFDVFAVSHKLNSTVCKQLCQKVVSRSAHESMPIKLSLATEQGSSMRAILRNFYKAKPPRFTDAVVVVKPQPCEAQSPEKPLKLQDNHENLAAHDNDTNSASKDATTCLENSDSLATSNTCQRFCVHRAVVASACDFIRGLWAGTFIESSGVAELELEERTASAATVQALLELIYGNSIELSSIKDVVDLFCLADRWQCSAVQTAALVQIEAHLDPVEGLALLEQSMPPPTPLMVAAATAVARNVPTTLSWEVAIRLLEVAGQTKAISPLIPLAQRCILQRLCDDTVDKRGLGRLDPRVFGPVLMMIREKPAVSATGQTVRFEQHNSHIRVWCTRVCAAIRDTVKIAGPAKVTFTLFDVGIGQVKINSQPYSGKCGPEPLTVEVGQTQCIEWTTVDSRYHGSFSGLKGWEITVTGIVPAPSKQQLINAVTEWASRCHLDDSTSGRQSGSLEKVFQEHIPLRRLHELSQEVPDKDSSPFFPMFSAVFTSQFEKHGVALAVKLLNACVDVQRCSDMAFRLAIAWIAADFEKVSQTSEWLHICPAAVVVLLREIVQTKCDTTVLLPQRLVNWAHEHACIANTEEAMACLGYLWTAPSPKIRDVIVHALDLCINKSDETAASLAVTAFNVAFADAPFPRVAVGSAETICSDAEVASPPTKRRKTQAWLDNEVGTSRETNARGLFGDAAQNWAQDQQHFKLLSSSAAWQHLMPAALLRALRHVYGSNASNEAAREEVLKAATSWVCCAKGPTVFDALGLAAKEMDPVWEALHAAAKQRFVEAERQHIALGGGKFREEIDAAVGATQKAAETERAAAIAELNRSHREKESTWEAQLAEVQNQLAVEATANQKCLENAQLQIVETVKRVLRTGQAP